MTLQFVIYAMLQLRIHDVVMFQCDLSDIVTAEFVTLKMLHATSCSWSFTGLLPSYTRPDVRTTESSTRSRDHPGKKIKIKTEAIKMNFFVSGRQIGQGGRE